MAIAIYADVPEQTSEGYEQTIRVLGDLLKGAPGFIMHFGHPIEGGWRVIEVWESSKDAAEWFAKYVRPNLPLPSSHSATFRSYTHSSVGDPQGPTGLISRARSFGSTNHP